MADLEKLNQAAQNVFDWLIQTFGEKYVEAFKEKNDEKVKLLKSALLGAFRGLEHVLLLSTMDKIASDMKKSSRSTETRQEGLNEMS